MALLKIFGSSGESGGSDGHIQGGGQAQVIRVKVKVKVVAVRLVQ